MKIFNRLSIKSKMTAIIMLTSCLALIAACLVLIGYELVSYRKIMVRQLSMLAEITGKNCAGFILADKPRGAEDILANLASEKQIVSAAIYTPEGVLWAKYPKSLPDSAFREKPDGNPAGHRFNSSGLHVFMPIVLNGDRQPLGLSYIHSNLDEMYSRLYQHIGAVAAVLGLASVVALLISARLQRVISGPVLDLAQT